MPSPSLSVEEQEAYNKKQYLDSLKVEDFPDEKIFQHFVNLGESLPFYLGEEWSGEFWRFDSTAIVSVDEPTIYNELYFTERTLAAKLFDNIGASVIRSMYYEFRGSEKVKNIEVKITGRLGDLSNSFAFGLPLWYGYLFEISVVEPYINNEITVEELVNRGQVFIPAVGSGGERINPIWR